MICIMCLYSLHNINLIDEHLHKYWANLHNCLFVKKAENMVSLIKGTCSHSSIKISARFLTSIPNNNIIVLAGEEPKQNVICALSLMKIQSQPSALHVG